MSRRKNFKCKLLPYQREDVISIQEVMQKVGWEITAFNLPVVWQFSQGEGVKIAVIDTGCDLDHPDLVDNLLTGKNFVNPSLPPDDDSSHGTHVCGILCASNNDIGMVGIAPKCKIVPVKALDRNGSGELRLVADAIRWSVNQGVDFITMSLGSPNPVPIIYDAIKYATEKKVIVFCAAGNAGKTRTIYYPANYKETIGVGAIDENFNRARFSCTGDDLDFLAPGVKILSTVPDNWYALMSGTSMANPFVVGICALFLSYVRAHNLKINLDNAEDYRNILKKHVIPSSDPKFAGTKFWEGFGIIDPRSMEGWAVQHHL